MVGLTTSMHFQQSEDFILQNFPAGEHIPGPPRSFVSSARSWPIKRKLIFWFQLLRYALPHKKSWLRVCLLHTL